MSDSTNLVPWFALAVSIVSLCFVGLTGWISREKLRLDLYNRRFDVYSRTLDLLHELDGWRPTEMEKTSTSLQESPQLEKALRAFIKASREARFLFDDDSGVQKQLEQINADTFAIIGFKRDIAPNPHYGGPDFLLPYNDFLKRLERVHASVTPLEEAMSKYLNFHAISAWW
jgi:hypothetical protein